MRLRAVIAAAFIAGAGHMLVQAQGPGQEQTPPVFRSGVTLVQIDAFVTDGQGNPVTGLTAGDFEVLEAGQRRPVATFSAVDIPIDPPVGLPGDDTTEPDVQTNARPVGRTYLIAFDEVSPDRTLRARNFVRRFIAEHMGPNDVAAVALTGRGLASSGQGFTSNRRLLLDAVDKFSGGFELSTPNVEDRAGFQGPAEDKAFSSDQRQLAASLRSLTEFLATLPGRKTLLYIGEGTGGLDFFDVVDYNGGALTPAAVDAHEAVVAATRGNVTIYPVDPRGLTTDLTPSADITGRVGESRILENRADLVALADVTGGFAITNTNNLGDGFARIVRENSTYYTIGFNSEYARRDGRFVRVEVRVKRPGLQVRARNGYVAPLGNERKPEPVASNTRLPAVKDALASATSTPGLPLRVFAAPYKAAGKTSTIALTVEMDVSALGLQSQQDARTGDIEISYLAVDATDKIHPGRRHTATLAVKGKTTTGDPRQDVRLLSQFELPDGRYQLRVAAGTASTAGSVVYDLEVPDFTKSPLALSGVSLTSVAAAAVTTLKPHDPLADVLAGPPTASREFASNDQIVLFAEVYDNRQPGRNATADTIEFATAISTEGGRIIRGPNRESRAANAWRRKSGGHGFTARLPLDGLEPGPYVILVEARSGGADSPTVSRRIPIRVQPPPALLSGVTPVRTGAGTGLSGGLGRVLMTRIDRLEVWVSAVIRHEPRSYDDPLKQISEWSSEDLRWVSIDLASLVTLVRDPDTRLFFMPPEVGPQNPLVTRTQQLKYSDGDLKRLRGMAASIGGRADGRENQLLRRGAMLHADIAMLAPDAGSAGSGGLVRYHLPMNDGRPGKVVTTVNHFEMGRRILDRVSVREKSNSTPRGPESDEWARLWYVATISHMLAEGDLTPLHFERALAIFPKDAEVLFLSAVMHEVLAGPRRQAAMRTADVPVGAKFPIGTRREELADAERLYRRALDSAPEFVEARIRYGHVLGQRGRHAEAVNELRKTVSAKSPLLQYYAALFLAGELEALGKEDEARSEYGRAADLFPGAQTPRLALSRLASGPDRAAAREKLVTLALQEPVGGGRDDPWWQYDVAPGRATEAVFAVLHRMLAAGER